MIEIIAGTFGYYNGRKVIPITKEDGPQKFDPELEAVWSRSASPNMSTSSLWHLFRLKSRSRILTAHPRPARRLPLPNTTRT